MMSGACVTTASAAARPSVCAANPRFQATPCGRAAGAAVRVRSSASSRRGGGGSGGEQPPLLEHLELHKAVGHNKGSTSPWDPPMPEAHEILPAFVELVVNKHLHAPTIIDWFDGVYLMLSAQRAEVDTPLTIGMTDRQRRAVRLPLHHEPQTGYLLLGWCLLNRRLDPRCVAIEFMEVPATVRGRGLGRALLALLERKVSDLPILPADPREDSKEFWLGCSHATLGRLVEEQGLSVARQLCLAKLGWSGEFFDAMLDRHRQAVVASTVKA